MFNSLMSRLADSKRRNSQALLTVTIVILGTAIVSASVALLRRDALPDRQRLNPLASVMLSAQDIDGGALAPLLQSGKVLLVNFWATWCGPCLAELPDLVELQNKYRDRLLIIGVSEDELPSRAISQFAIQHQVNYPVMRTVPEIEFIAEIAALPTTVLVDPVDGRVVKRYLGRLRIVDVDRDIRAMIPSPKPTANRPTG